MSYLIEDQQVIAITSEALKSGLNIQVSYQVVENDLNSNKEKSLVNAFTVKVSNDKKWDTYENKFLTAIAIGINGSNSEFKLYE